MREDERRHLANAIAAMKPEWDIGDDSRRAWKKFVEAFQSRKILLISTSEQNKLRRRSWWSFSVGLVAILVSNGVMYTSLVFHFPDYMPLNMLMLAASLGGGALFWSNV